METICAECHCNPRKCNVKNIKNCNLCLKNAKYCCCGSIHTQSATFVDNFISRIHLSSEFISHVKYLYPAALGLEILCIIAAEIGENIALYLFGFNHIGIPVAYILGYGLAGFVTFVTILGRYNYNNNGYKQTIDICCSVLAQNADKGFLINLKTTYLNFGRGIQKVHTIYRQHNVKYILRTTIFILITAESVCILTAETVDLIFYNHSLLLSIPLALLAGAFTIVAPGAFKKLCRK